MKTKILLFAFLLVLSTKLQAAIITVVNGESLQTKINAATAGDILIVGPGTYSENIVLNKKLTLFGPGYLRSSGGDAFITGYLYFAGGSDGSYASGFSIGGEVLIITNNNTIIRNKVGNSLYMGTDGTTHITTSGNKIIQNYLCTNNAAVSNDNRVYIGLSPALTQTNYLFKNNIVMTKIGFFHSNSSTGIVENNVFDPDNNNTNEAGYQNTGYLVGGGINGISFYNNIFKGRFPNLGGGMFLSAEFTPLNFKWNIVDVLTHSISLPANNLVTTDDIYVGYPNNVSSLNNADGRVILKPLSPASNYGRVAPYGSGDAAIDAGAYGGSKPYVLNGIPVGPYVYSLAVPPIAAVNSQIPVTVKARTNN